MTTTRLPPPPAGPVPRGISTFNLWAYRVALAAGFALLVIVTTGVLWVGLVFWALEHDEPDREPRSEMAAAGAAWAGFPDTTGLELLSLEHSYGISEGWELVWRATDAAAAQRFLEASDLRAPFEECQSFVLSTQPTLEGLSGCETARDRRQQPAGYTIGRRLTRGRGPDGALVVYLSVTR